MDEAIARAFGQYRRTLESRERRMVFPRAWSDAIALRGVDILGGQFVDPQARLLCKRAVAGNGFINVEFSLFGLYIDDRWIDPVVGRAIVSEHGAFFVAPVDREGVYPAICCSDDAFSSGLVDREAYEHVLDLYRAEHGLYPGTWEGSLSLLALVWFGGNHPDVAFFDHMASLGRLRAGCLRFVKSRESSPRMRVVDFLADATDRVDVALLRAWLTGSVIVAGDGRDDRHRLYGYSGSQSGLSRTTRAISGIMSSAGDSSVSVFDVAMDGHWIDAICASMASDMVTSVFSRAERRLCFVVVSDQSEAMRLESMLDIGLGGIAHGNDLVPEGGWIVGVRSRVLRVSRDEDLLSQDGWISILLERCRSPRVAEQWLRRASTHCGVVVERLEDAAALLRDEVHAVIAEIHAAEAELMRCEDVVRLVAEIVPETDGSASSYLVDAIVRLDDLVVECDAEIARLQDHKCRIDCSPAVDDHECSAVADLTATRQRIRNDVTDLEKRLHGEIASLRDRLNRLFHCERTVFGSSNRRDRGRGRVDPTSAALFASCGFIGVPTIEDVTCEQRRVGDQIDALENRLVVEVSRLRVEGEIELQSLEAHVERDRQLRFMERNREIDEHRALLGDVLSRRRDVIFAREQAQSFVKGVSDLRRRFGLDDHETLDAVRSKVDVTLRARAAVLARRYWEGMFLLRMDRDGPALRTIWDRLTILLLIVPVVVVDLDWLAGAVADGKVYPGYGVVGRVVIPEGHRLSTADCVAALAIAGTAFVCDRQPLGVVREGCIADDARRLVSINGSAASGSIQDIEAKSEEISELSEVS